MSTSVLETSQILAPRYLKWSTVCYGVPFSHLFTELQISPIEMHISPIQLQISTIDLQISTIQLEVSPNRLNCRYLQFNWRYRPLYKSIADISKYCLFGDISN